VIADALSPKKYCNATFARSTRVAKRNRISQSEDGE
jgi:hypothetical protein